MRLKEKARSLLEGGGNGYHRVYQGRQNRYFTINRPDKMNVLNVEAMRQFTDLLKSFATMIACGWASSPAPVRRFSVPVSTSRIFFHAIRKTPDKKWQRPTAIMRGMDLWKPMICRL